MSKLSYTETPVQELRHPAVEKAGIRLLVKREDLNHPFISGNKWWKLKYNLNDAIEKDFKTIFTFGGAFSNHIYATAAAARELGLGSIGVIRGEETLPLNNTLAFAHSMGMQIHYVSRSRYRNKMSSAFVDDLHRLFGPFYMIPEGGTNLLAVKGCYEFGLQLNQIPFDHLFVAVGTGGTISGIISALEGSKTITGVAVLKNGGFLLEEISLHVRLFTNKHFDNWSLMTSHHHGGYAKTTPALLSFMREIQKGYDLPLDHVYTAKLLFAVFEEISRGSFARGSTVLAVHTGGMQGSIPVV